MPSPAEKSSRSNNKVLTGIGIALCVILIPLLIVNCTLLVKSWINKDEVPTFGSVFPLIVLTDSMYDEFPSGSLIICKVVDPAEIREGDVISFFDPESTSGAITTHQVVGIEKDAAGTPTAFRTKGTANNTEDNLPVPAEDVVGRWTGVRFKGVGSVAMFMQTTPGLILCVFVPLLLLVGYDIVRRRLYDRKHDTDKDDLMRELEELRKMKAAQECAAQEGASRSPEKTDDAAGGPDQPEN